MTNESCSHLYQAHIRELFGRCLTCDIERLQRDLAASRLLLDERIALAHPLTDEPSADPKRDALLQIKDFALGVGPDYYVIAGIVNRVLGISDGAGCTCDRGPCSIHRAHENRGGDV